MIEFLAKYWIEFVFGIIAAWLLGKIKKIQDLEKKAEEDAQKKLSDDIMKQVDEKLINLSNESASGDKELHVQIDSLNLKVDNMSKAILSMQGKQFKDTCKMFLQDDYVISTEEYLECIKDHDAYNGIGGNHQGDLLFKAVCKKYNAQVQGE